MKAKKRKRTNAEYVLLICFGWAILSMLFEWTSRGAAIFAMVLLTVSALGFVWIPQYASPRAVQILLTASVSTLWLPKIPQMPMRICVLADTVFLLAVACAALWVWFRKGKYYVPAAFAGVLVLIGFSTMDLYTFVQNPNGAHFWKISLTLAAVGCIICIHLLLQGKIQLKDNRLSERVFLPILVLGGCFSLFWLTAQNLNYALDRSTPTRFETVITEKRSEYHTRAGEYYYITARLNGEAVELSVLSGEYERVQIGDAYPVLQYDGALGDSYYIPNTVE